MLRRSVASLTRTPLWLLWLVMMTPAFIWSSWRWAYGPNSPIPLVLAIGSFVVCFFIYWFLVQAGRRELPPPADQSTETSTATPGASPVQTPPAPANVRPINREEETQLRNCFPSHIYALQKLEFRPQAVICWGQLRSTPDAAYQTIQENIQQLFGDRFLVVFQEDIKGKPFFALVTNPYRPSATKAGSEPLRRPGLALALLFITLFTTTVVGAEIAGVNANELQTNPLALLSGLPYALALMAILGVHESGHYFAAQFYKIRTTLPYFIPVPFFLGTFGAFIQMRSPVPTRKALFDVSIAGPLAGFVITLPVLLWGLANSSAIALSEQSGLLSFESLNPRFSLLLTLLSKLVLGSRWEANSAIALHPIAIAGYLGLVVTAFNLMPVGQLDGGHIVHAMFGQRMGAAIGQITRFLLLGLAFVQPDLLLWAILLFLMPTQDEPALNDVTELNNFRDLLGLFALGLLILILLPAPNLLLEWLNL